MPTYDYECEVCGKEEEVFHGMNDEGPNCHDKPMKKLLSAAWIRKGAGLHSMDIESKKLGEYK